MKFRVHMDESEASQVLDLQNVVVLRRECGRGWVGRVLKEDERIINGDRWYCNCQTCEQDGKVAVPPHMFGSKASSCGTPILRPVIIGSMTRR